MTFFLNFKFPGSLRRDLRQGKPLAKAEGSEQRGQGRYAYRLGLSNFGLGGWPFRSLSGFPKAIYMIHMIAANDTILHFTGV